METDMKKPSKGVAFLGFFITFLMVICLVSGGVLMSVKTTILNGNDINEILENNDIYGTISQIVVSDISASKDEMGFSKEAVEKIFSKDVLKDSAATMMDAIKNNEDIDFSGMKDECMDIVKEVSNKAVDDIFDEIKKSSDVVSVEVLKQSEIIKQLEKDYNVDISSVIVDYVEDTYGDVTVNIEDIDIEQVKEDTKKSLDETVIPAIEETVDEYIVEVNASVNKQIKETNEEYNISDAINMIESALNIVNIIMIVTLALSFMFALLQIVVLYKKRMNRGFRNVSIAMLISGIVVLLVGIILNVAKSLFESTVGDGNGNLEHKLLDFITGNIGNVSTRTMIIGFVYFGMAVVFMVVAIILKKKISNMGNGSTQGSTYKNDIV